MVVLKGLAIKESMVGQSVIRIRQRNTGINCVKAIERSLSGERIVA